MLANMEAILAEWEEFARSLSPGAEMSVIALRDHAEIILRVTARDMHSPQTPQQQSKKSKGEGGDGAESQRLDTASEQHAIGRLEDGFNLIDVVSEYRALRASVLKLWQEAAHEADEHDLKDLTRFNESIDQSLAEAVRSYTSRVDESRELFLATLGHDLRAPLNAMMLSAQVLARSGQLDDENRQIASRMATYGHVMTGMIHDLLDFTRTRLGAGMPIVVAPLVLSTLCEEVLEEFRTAYPDRRLCFEAAGDVSGQWDAARLRQVLSNLIANAIEHGEADGAIEVWARSEGSKVLLTVTNQGPVIASSELPTIFNPFVRATSMRRSNKRRGGIGLGLYIAREIVLAHAGTISVASSETTGTVFTVCLPRQHGK
ncbi:MAG TPA: HAMP domain-containing sensor histidine kinase [Thermoanaerobaculia bacterium]